MAWCRQATNHYLSQCWPRSLLPYDVTRPQWVNTMNSQRIWSNKLWYNSTVMWNISHKCVNSQKTPHNSPSRVRVSYMGCLLLVFWRKLVVLLKILYLLYTSSPLEASFPLASDDILTHQADSWTFKGKIPLVDTLRPEQNGCHFADNMHFL